MKYLPFLNGKYSTAPGLTAVEKAVCPEDGLIFQIDKMYENYLQNKQACRDEDIGKYYLEKSLWTKTSSVINWFIVQKLRKEYPQYFVLEKLHNAWKLVNKRTGKSISWNLENELISGTEYGSLFDALCSQVQEDVAIVQLNREDDWLAAIHLCSPNYWAPEDKVGRPFDQIHAPVAEMEKTTRNYFKMLELVVSKGPFSRFAWGITTDARLNHHPVAPPGVDEDEWYGRKIAGNETKFYVRTERQSMVGFPGVNAFLFTIRTYYYDVDSLQAEEKTALSDALKSMTPASLAYKGLTDKIDLLQLKLM